MDNKTKHLFPIFINLDNKKCVIVGGGKVAERKAENLFAYGASITILSPSVTSKVQQWANEGLLNWRKKEFEKADIDGAFMVFASTDNYELNQLIANICHENGIMINSADDPEKCTFHVPAIIRRDSLGIAISTEGKSPLLAKKLRTEFEALIGEEYAEFLDMLAEVRTRIQESVSDINIRKKILESIVYSDILEHLKSGENEKARERIEACISSFQE